MGRPFLQRLTDGDILLCDGGMGTALQVTAGVYDCPERLNLERPDAVATAHKGFYDAGSDLVETNTFGGTRSRLKLHGLEHRVEEISIVAAQIARSVCPETGYVLGSIGPTGEMLEPYGDTESTAVFDMFAEQAIALAKGGVDGLIIETMMDAEEARLAVRAAKENTDLPVIATMTFATRGGVVRTRWGVDVATAVRVLQDAGADVVGSNCGDGFDEMLIVISEMRPLTTLPIIAQANAGIPTMVDGVAVYKETASDILPKALQLLDLGVNILGGCCGTQSAHIRAMREAVDK